MSKFEIGEYTLIRADYHGTEMYLHCEVIGIEEQVLSPATYTIRVLKPAAYGILDSPVFYDVKEDALVKTPTFRYAIPMKIIYNDPATIVFWEDGTKTVVKRSKGEKYNKYNAFCAAVAKKMYGTNTQVNKIVRSGKEQTQKKGAKKQCRSK